MQDFDRWKHPRGSAKPRVAASIRKTTEIQTGAVAAKKSFKYSITYTYCTYFSMASCTAGQLPIRHADLQVEIKITAHHKGHFEFSICRLGLRIKVLQGGSCVFVQYLFGCRLHSSRMFWYVPPNLFSRCFSGANRQYTFSDIFPPSTGSLWFLKLRQPLGTPQSQM